ncbi:MAG: hypothetical protein ACI31R_02955, partial [Bacilli bacterium]
EQKTAPKETSERTTSNEQKTAPKETNERATSNEQKTTTEETSNGTTPNEQKTTTEETDVTKLDGEDSIKIEKWEPKPKNDTTAPKQASDATPPKETSEVPRKPGIRSRLANKSNRIKDYFGEKFAGEKPVEYEPKYSDEGLYIDDTPVVKKDGVIQKESVEERVDDFYDKYEDLKNAEQEILSLKNEGNLPDSEFYEVDKKLDLEKKLAEEEKIVVIGKLDDKIKKIENLYQEKYGADIKNDTKWPKGEKDFFAKQGVDYHDISVRERDLKRYIRLADAKKDLESTPSLFETTPNVDIDSRIISNKDDVLSGKYGVSDGKVDDVAEIIDFNGRNKVDEIYEKAASAEPQVKNSETTTPKTEENVSSGNDDVFDNGNSTIDDFEFDSTFKDVIPETPKIEKGLGKEYEDFLRAFDEENAEALGIKGKATDVNKLGGEDSIKVEKWEPKSKNETTTPKQTSDIPPKRIINLGALKDSKIATKIRDRVNGVVDLLKSKPGEIKRDIFGDETIELGSKRLDEKLDVKEGSLKDEISEKVEWDPDALEQEMKNIDEKIELEQKQLEDINNEIALKKGELEEQFRDEISKEVENNRKFLDDLEKPLQDKKGTLTKELENVDGKLKDIEQAKNKLSDKVDNEINKKLEEAKDSLGYNDRTIYHEERIETLKADKAKVQEELKKGDNEWNPDALEQEIKDIDKKIELEQKYLEDVNNEIALKKGELEEQFRDEISKEVEDKRKLLDELEKPLQDKKDALTKEVENVDGKLKDIEQTKNKLSDEVDNEINKKLEEVKDDLGFNDRTTYHEERIESLKTDKAKVQEELKKGESDTTIDNKQVEENTDIDLEELHNRFDELDEKLNAENRNRTTEEVTALEEKISQLENNLEFNSEMVSHHEAKLKDLWENGGREIELKEAENAIYKQDYDDLMARIDGKDLEDCKRSMDSQISEKERVLNDVFVDRIVHRNYDGDYVYTPNQETIISNYEEFKNIIRQDLEANKIDPETALFHENRANERLRELKSSRSAEFDEGIDYMRSDYTMDDLYTRMDNNIKDMFDKKNNNKVNTNKPFSVNDLEEEVEHLKNQRKMLDNIYETEQKVKQNAQELSEAKQKWQREIGESNKWLQDAKNNCDELREEIANSKEELATLQNKPDNVIEFPKTSEIDQKAAKASGGETGGKVENKTNEENIEEAINKWSDKVDEVIDEAKHKAKVGTGMATYTAGESTIRYDGSEDDQVVIPVDSADSGSNNNSNTESDNGSSDNNSSSPDNDNSSSGNTSSSSSSGNSSSSENTNSNSKDENTTKTEDNTSKENNTTSLESEDTISNSENDNTISLENNDSSTENDNSNIESDETDLESSSSTTENSDLSSSENINSNSENDNTATLENDTLDSENNTTSLESEKTNSTTETENSNNQVSTNTDSKPKNDSLNSDNNTVSSSENDSINSQTNEKVDFEKFRVNEDTDSSSEKLEQSNNNVAESVETEKENIENLESNSENSINDELQTEEEAEITTDDLETEEETENANSYNDYMEDNNDVEGEDSDTGSGNLKNSSTEEKEESTISKVTSFIKENPSSVGVGATIATGAGIVGVIKKSKSNDKDNDFEEYGDFSSNSNADMLKKKKKFHNPFTALRVKNEDDASSDD